MDTIKVEPCSFCPPKNIGLQSNLRISLAKHMIYKKLYKESEHVQFEIIICNHLFNEDKYFTEKWKQFTD